MKSRVPLVLATAAALLVAGCADDSGPDEAGNDTAAGASYPVTVGDLTLEAQPTAIMSLSATATEMLFAIGAGPHVVAVDEHSNYPADAPMTDLSGFTPNIEAIAGYNPDLVVYSYDPGDLGDQLETLGIPAHVVPDAATLDDTYSQIMDLGTLTGHVQEAAGLAERMSEEVSKLLADVPEREEPLTYFYELDDQLYTVTSQTFVGALFTMVGMENIADSRDPDGFGYPQLSAEVLVDADPDMIFLADTICCGQNAETVAARDGWAEIEAVRTGQVVELDDDIASRWGPRIVDLLREIVDAVSQVPVSQVP